MLMEYWIPFIKTNYLYLQIQFMLCCCKFQNLKETLLVQDFVTPNKLALWWIHSKSKSLKQLHCACSARPNFDAPGTKTKPKPLPHIGKNRKKKTYTNGSNYGYFSP